MLQEISKKGSAGEDDRIVAKDHSKDEEEAELWAGAAGVAGDQECQTS
jgi:hypothetical protein